MAANYTMYKFYRGEKTNPFNQDTQNAEYMFWFYESIFDRDFAKNASSEWYSFFSEHNMGDRFMKILSEGDYLRPGEDKKKQIFELWLEYLFTFKLYPEYGGENKLKAAYEAATAR